MDRITKETRSAEVQLQPQTCPWEDAGPTLTACHLGCESHFPRREWVPGSLAPSVPPSTLPPPTSHRQGLAAGAAYMCWDALGKRREYWGAESSGPWGAAWLMTIRTGLCGYIFLDVRKKLTLSLVMRSVR